MECLAGKSLFPPSFPPPAPSCLPRLLKLDLATGPCQPEPQKVPGEHRGFGTKILRDE